jgi:uncharacterized repeat protein (TIGR03803 family)
MQHRNLLPCVLTSCAAIALLAGCGGAPQTSTPATNVQDSRTAGVPHSSTSSSYQVLYRFDRYPNGSYPLAGLVNVKGTLYGTTKNGGKGCHRLSFGCGTVFSITPGGVHHLVYSFDPWQQGAYPQSGLIDVNGTLYGTTYQGGNRSVGTVYSISKSGAESVLYSFQGGSDGGYPAAPLLDVRGTLYGTTLNGGVKKHGSYHGTVFSISKSGAHTVLHDFKGPPDAMDPTGGLIDVNGTLYGVTASGGTTSTHCPDGCGTVYSITPGGVEKVVYRFTDTPDGASPKGSLLNVNGTLYGTTGEGGSGVCYGHPTTACGTVYSITTSGQEKVLYSFTGGTDGQAPQAGLIDVNGTLYGTTAEGGTGTGCGYGCGIVFSVTTGGAETVLYRFADAADGWYPVASLLYLNGTLYGTAENGAKSRFCCGTVFALTP